MQHTAQHGEPPMSEAALAERPVMYNDDVVKKFVIASVFWAIVAFLAGVYIASELAWPSLNLGLSFTNFGRLRPVHTSAAVFAFGGSALFATSFYVVQRTCRARACGAAKRWRTSCSGATSSSLSWRR